MGTQSELIHREFPNVEDRSVTQTVVALGALRSAILRGFKAVLENFRDKPVTPEFRLFVGVQLRMTECCLSLEILVSKGRNRDAAILLLTLLELRLDLRFVAQDPSRVAVWLSNTDVARKPWGVTKQIKSLFTHEAERDAELEMYRFLSMIKHGNPVSGISGFPASFEGDALAFYSVEADFNQSKTILFGAGTYLKDGFMTTIQLLPAAARQWTDVLADIHQRAGTLNELHERHVHAMMLSLTKSDQGAADV